MKLFRVLLRSLMHEASAEPPDRDAADASGAGSFAALLAALVTFAGLLKVGALGDRISTEAAINAGFRKLFEQRLQKLEQSLLDLEQRSTVFASESSPPAGVVLTAEPPVGEPSADGSASDAVADDFAVDFTEDALEDPHACALDCPVSAYEHRAREVLGQSVCVAADKSGILYVSPGPMTSSQWGRLHAAGLPISPAAGWRPTCEAFADLTGSGDFCGAPATCWEICEHDTWFSCDAHKCRTASRDLPWAAELRERTKAAADALFALTTTATEPVSP